MNFQSPKTLDAAVEILAEGNWSLISGGTDYYPSLGDKQPTGNIMDVSQIDGQRHIKQLDDGSWSFGACVTWTDIVKANLPPAFDGLKLAAREVGSIQIQNRATLAGNICNASPAADGMPPLLTLNALVEISSKAGTRKIAIQEFVQGNRQTALRNDEIVSAIIVPEAATKGVSNFIKLGARKYLVISISMVASRFVVNEQNEILEAAVSVGSCSLVAKRMTALEKELVGKTLSDAIGEIVTAEHLSELSPIDDVRSSGGYRMDASLELVRRSISNFSRRV